MTLPITMKCPVTGMEMKLISSRTKAGTRKVRIHRFSNQSLGRKCECCGQRIPLAEMEVEVTLK